MNLETLEEAKKINIEISKLKEAVNDISYHHKHAKKDMSHKGYDWMLRVFNQKNNTGTAEPMMYLFDNNDIHGSDIPIDEELLILIKGYFENKIKEKEKKFGELS